MTTKKKPESSTEEIAAREVVRLAKEQGLTLTGPDGLLKQFTENKLAKTALNEEMTEHLGHEKNRVPGGPGVDQRPQRDTPADGVDPCRRPGRSQGSRDREGTFERPSRLAGPPGGRVDPDVCPASL